MLCMIRGRHPAARSRRRVRVVGGQSLEWVCACSPHPASVRMSLRKPRGGASQRFWVGYGSVIGITMGFLTRAHVMENVFLELTLTLGLILGAIWFTALTNRLQRSLDQIENGDQMLDEIRESIEIVGQILNRLPELMPQFNMPQTNPLATLIESYFESIVDKMNTR